LNFAEYERKIQFVASGGFTMGGFIKGLFTAIGALATLLGAVALLFYAAGFVQVHLGPIGIQVFTTNSKIDIKDESKQEVKASAPTLALPSARATPAVLQTQPTPVPSPTPQAPATRDTGEGSAPNNRTDISKAASEQPKGRPMRQSRARHVYNYPDELKIEPAYTYEEPSSDSCTCPTVTATADDSTSPSEDSSQNSESYQQYRVGNTIVTRRVVRRVYHYRYPN
jgi:hypothetical protein